MTCFSIKIQSNKNKRQKNTYNNQMCLWTPPTLRSSKWTTLQDSLTTSKQSNLYALLLQVWMHNLLEINNFKDVVSLNIVTTICRVVTSHSYLKELSRQNNLTFKTHN